MLLANKNNNSAFLMHFFFFFFYQGTSRSKMPLAFAFALLLILPNLSLVSTQPVKNLNNKFVPVLPKEVAEVFNSVNEYVFEEGSGIFSGDCESQVDIPIVADKEYDENVKPPFPQATQHHQWTSKTTTTPKSKQLSKITRAIWSQPTWNFNHQKQPRKPHRDQNHNSKPRTFHPYYSLLLLQLRTQHQHVEKQPVIIFCNCYIQ